MKKYSKTIYYLIIIILFILLDKLIYLVPSKNYIDSNLLKLENDKLKQEIKELSNIEFNEYDYTLGKIVIKNVYNSKTYFIKTNISTNNNIVLNDKGFIGLLNNNYLTLTKDLTLSVSINDNLGILKDNEISIVKGNYSIGDEIYALNLNSINQKFLIGYVKEIKHNSLNDIIKVKYLDIESNYVGILK